MKHLSLSLAIVLAFASAVFAKEVKDPSGKVRVTIPDNVAWEVGLVPDTPDWLTVDGGDASDGSAWVLSVADTSKQAMDRKAWLDGTLEEYAGYEKYNLVFNKEGEINGNKASTAKATYFDPDAKEDQVSYIMVVTGESQVVLFQVILPASKSNSLQSKAMDAIRSIVLE